MERDTRACKRTHTYSVSLCVCVCLREARSDSPWSCGSAPSPDQNLECAAPWTPHTETQPGPRSRSCTTSRCSPSGERRRRKRQTRRRRSGDRMLGDAGRERGQTQRECVATSQQGRQHSWKSRHCQSVQTRRQHPSIHQSIQRI